MALLDLLEIIIYSIFFLIVLSVVFPIAIIVYCMIIEKESNDIEQNKNNENNENNETISNLQEEEHTLREDAGILFIFLIITIILVGFVIFYNK